MEGFGGNIYVPLEEYSFKMSFCIVPLNFSAGTPCFSATTMYMANKIAAGELIVMEVLTRSRGILWKSVSMSSRESMATPTFPTSPMAISSSES